MGALTFQSYAEGADVDKTFQAAVDQALYDHGHSGYTGTIAEKDSYVIIEAAPMTPEAAEKLADKLIRDNDERICDKRGPAGAIAVKGGTRTLEHLPIPQRDGGYPDLRTAANAAATNLAEGESLEDVPSAQYAMRPGGGVSGTGVVTVTTTGSPDQTGWLFFGSASY